MGRGLIRPGQGGDDDDQSQARAAGRPGCGARRPRRQAARRTSRSSASAPAARPAPTFPIGGLIANAISNPPGSRTCADGGSCGVPGLVATAVASNGSVANVAGIAGGSMQSGFVQSDVAYWALQRHRHLRGPAEGRRAARHRQPLSRELPPGGAQGRRHQVDQGPQGQAHLARRAGLGHAGRCPPDPRRLRHDREGHQGRVPEAAAVGRQAQGRRARRLLQRRRLAAGRHRRTGGDDRHRPRADRRAGGREPDQAVQLLRRRRDPRRRLQGRRRREDGQRQRDLGDLEQAARPADLQRHRRAVEPEHAQAARFRPRQGPRDQARDRRCRASASRCMPGAEKFYKEKGLIK